MHNDRSNNSGQSRARAFTIVELLVVIGVIGVLALMTTLGARRLTAGSRLAAATNAVTSALGNGDGCSVAAALCFDWSSANSTNPMNANPAKTPSSGSRVRSFSSDRTPVAESIRTNRNVTTIAPA